MGSTCCATTTCSRHHASQPDSSDAPILKWHLIVLTYYVCVPHTVVAKCWLDTRRTRVLGRIVTFHEEPSQTKSAVPGLDLRTGYQADGFIGSRWRRAECLFPRYQKTAT